MCVTNNVCIILLIKNVFNDEVIFLLLLFLFPRTKNKTYEFFMPKCCLLLAIFIMVEIIWCCFFLLLWFYRRKFVAAKIWVRESWLYAFTLTSLLLFRNPRWLLSRCVNFCLCPKRFWDCPISRTDLFQNNVFEILNDFCQKFEFRLWWIFSYTKPWFFTSERVKMKNSFFAISHLYAKKKFFIIYFLHQTVYDLSSQKEFSLFSFAFLMQYALFTSLLFCIYTQSPFSRPSHNVLRFTNFKFVVVQKENTKNPRKLFFSFVNTKISNPPRSSPHECSKIFFARLKENAKKNGEAEKCFHFRLQAEEKNVFILCSSSCATRIIDWMSTV